VKNDQIEQKRTEQVLGCADEKRAEKKIKVGRYLVIFVER
jgi:hypothetical protein|tara:strand:+ start:992 stop:1111 length:120 start_codon:yes stop_codon:yes gene_type:complete